MNELKRRGIFSIRTGVSWAEWVTPGGRELITWYLNELHSAGFDILPNLTYTPPEIAVEPGTNYPPRQLGDYARATYELCTTCGHCFEYIELWNEPNLETDWKGSYSDLAIMLGGASLIARHFGKKVVLGGIAGVRPQSLDCIRELTECGFLHFVDVIGFHALRGTWSDKAPPPPLHVQADMIREVARENANTGHMTALRKHVRDEARKLGGEEGDIMHAELEKMSRKQFILPSIWLTEYGFTTGDPHQKFRQPYLEKIQVAVFADALDELEARQIDRIYWYTLEDRVSDSVRKITTGWEDELQHFYGMITPTGKPKLLGRLLLKGFDAVTRYVKERGILHLVDEASLPRSRIEGYTSQDRSP